MKKQIIFLVLTIVVFMPCTDIYAQAEFLPDNPWPREIVSDKGTIVIYQPQVESFDEFKLDSRAAVSVTTAGDSEMIFGAMWFECKLYTDKDERLVYLEEIKVTASRFPDVEEQKVNDLISFIEAEVPGWELVISLDRLLASIDPSDESMWLQENYNNNPPEIIFSEKPSVLILIDGEPVLREIEGTGFEYVMNTPFFLTRDKNTGKHYLSGAGFWFSSDDILNGWKNTSEFPEELKEIAEKAFSVDEERFTEESENGNEKPDGPPLVSGTPENDTIVPEVYVRTNPTELLQSDGKPEYAPLAGTSLLYMTNTDNDILMNINTQEYYVLISGRWYKSKSLDSNNWTFINPKELPEDFAAIPPDSDMAPVRSSVYGTTEAKEAVLENQIPQTAVVSREEALITVEYDGKPQFESITGTEMQYAVNTDKSVLLINGRYYCCDDAVWFESENPDGPWAVSVIIPEQVEDLPPESPVYNIKYVTIYSYTPEVVYVGYTPGYMNSYVYMGCVYYGTGWYYRPWYGSYYYPRPVTYGFSVRYNPYTGWGFSYGVSWGGPVWMAFGWHPPYYGYWGPAGYRHGYHHGYHHGYRHGYNAGARAGYYYGKRSTTAGNNIYRNRSNGVSRTGGNNYNPRNGQRISQTESGIKRSTKPSDRSNNVFTDKSGNVYRNDNNKWQQRENKQWKDASPSTRPSENNQQNRQSGQNVSKPQPRQNINNLDRDYNARNRGSERSNNYNSNRQNYQYNRPSATPRSNPGGRNMGGRK